MGEKRINYICCFCGQKEKRRISAGRPASNECHQNKHGGTHFWVDRFFLDEELYSRLYYSKTSMTAKNMYTIGCYYAIEELGYYNIGKTIEWYEEAANHAFGKNNLPDNKELYAEVILALILLYDSNKFGIENKTKTLNWFHSLAKLGHIFSMLNLAYSCESVSYEERIEWCRKLAEAMTWPPHFDIHGADDCSMWDGIITDFSEFDSPETIYGMKQRGYAYEYGIAGAEQNDTEAIKWYQKCYNCGDTYGMFSLAKAYEKGRGVGKNLEKSWQLYSMAIAKEFKLDNEGSLSEWLNDIKNKLIATIPNFSLGKYLRDFLHITFIQEKYFRSLLVNHDCLEHFNSENNRW